MKLSRKYKKRIKRLVKRVLNKLGGIVTVFFASLAMCKLMGFSVPLNRKLDVKTIAEQTSESELEINENEEIMNTSDEEELLQDDMETTVTESDSVSVENRLENTERKTYIYTAQDLVDFRDSVNAGDDYAGKTVYLMDNIDLSTVCSSTLGSWVPIGNATTNFDGTFDGNGKTISEIYIKNSSTLQGLFRELKVNGIIKDLTIKGNMTQGANDWGGLVARNYGKIILVKNEVVIGKSGNIYRTGGITGGNCGIIEKCYNTATISTYDSVGGIAGANCGTIKECYNLGAIYGAGWTVGGIAGHVGESWGSGYVYNCYNNASVTAGHSGYVGGITGGIGQSNKRGYIYNSYTVNNSNIYGHNYSYYTIQNCYTPSVNIKTYTATLGSEFAYDIYNKNSGYPVLAWQNETPVMSLNKNQTYIKVDEKLQLNVVENEEIDELVNYNYNALNFKWTSTNEDVATVNENGEVTGVSDGYTTIYAYNEEADLYAMAVVNVAKNFANPQIETGNGFTAILKADGTVWTIGNNKSGQLGNGTNINTSETVKVHIDENTELNNIVKIAVGSDHVLALTKDGNVYAWGSNTQGELGQNNDENSNYAKLVLNEDGTGNLSDIVDISANGIRSMALDKNGNSYVWGNGTLGEIGNKAIESSKLPVKNDVDKGIKVSIGLGSVGVLRSDGILWAWGRNNNGSLGINATANTSYGMKTALNVTDFSHSGPFSAVKKVNGEVYTVGFNGLGALGTGDTTNHTTYVKATLPSSVTEGNTKVKYIQAGLSNTILLLSDETIWETGHNVNGQLGNGTTTTSTLFVQGLTASETPLENVLTIGRNVGNINGSNTAGWGLNTAVIRKDGNIYTTGDNTYGQVGSTKVKKQTSYYRIMGDEPYLTYKEPIIEMSSNDQYTIDRNKLEYIYNPINVYGEKLLEIDNLRYKSLDKSIATVDQNGVITAQEVRTGATKVKIEDIDNGYETYITIIVNKLQNTDMITYIYDIDDLVAFRDNVNNGNDYEYKTVYLMADIDMSTACSEIIGSWEPIGNITMPFKGKFYGNYHKIEKIYINENAVGNAYYGLFGYCNEAKIANIEIKNGNINITGGNTVGVGSIVGYMQNGKITNCGNNINVTSLKSQRPLVGGVCGSCSGSLTGCYNRGIIYATSSSNYSYAGGVLGYNAGTMSNCYNMGKVSAYRDGASYNTQTGGVSGENAGTITRCYNAGLVYGDNNYGSITACNYGTITYSYFANTTPNKLVGYNAGSSSENASVELETLKTYATTLGYAFRSDTININNEYPILKWELPQYKIVENQEYIKIGQSQKLTLEKLMFRENDEDDLSDIEWTSSNEEVATVNSKGLVIGTGIGHTTITAYNPKNGLKAKSIINVYRNKEGAITIPQVQMGNGFTVALKEDGTVWTSGLNDKGQLGDGTTTNRNILAQVKIDENTYLTNIKKIASSYSYTLALTVDGEVYAWGNNKNDNGNGWLGQGDTNNRLYATKVKGENGKGNIKDIIDINTGDRMSYVVDRDRVIYGAGYDAFCQITDTTANKLYLNEVTKIEDAVQITGGYCGLGALTSNAEVWIKGFNQKGQFGNGSTSTTAGIYLIGTDIDEIKLSDGGFGVILKEDKAVWVTGVNNNGQLGLGDTTNRTSYTQMKFENGDVVKAKAISVGTRNVQFIGEDGKVYVTGYNGKGQLSNGTTTDATYPIPMKNLDKTEVTDSILLVEGKSNNNNGSLSSNMGIIRQDGTVWMSGDNTYGQIGNGTSLGSSYMKQFGIYLSGLNKRNEYVKIGENIDIDVLGTSEFNVFIQEASNQNKWTWTWKSSNEDVATIDENGVVTGKGVGHTTITAHNSENELKAKAIINVYRNVDGAITVPQVEIGEGYTVILKEDGTVWSTGKNDVGQLGDGTTTNRNILKQVKIDENTYLTNVKKISIGYEHTVALTIDGKVYAWGGNTFRKLGQGDITNSPYAVQIKGENGQGYIEDIIDISAGDYSTFLLNENGITYGIGYNKWGQIDDTRTDTLYPKIVEGFDKAIALTAGYSNVGVIKSNGETWAKGDNAFGAFGNNKAEAIGGKYQISKDVNYIELSGFFGAILKEDGTVWTSGRNEVGQLGLGDTTDRTTYTQVKFSDGTEVKAKNISSTTKNLQFIGEDGKVYVTGNNANGQLSNGSATNAKYPTVMKNADGTDVTDSILISSGEISEHTENPLNIGIIRKDGTVWMSGDNTYGQMGNGTNEGSKYLTQVGKDILSYEEDTIVIGVNEIRIIKKDLFKYEPQINVFISKNTWMPSLVYEIEDDNIASITNLGVLLGKSKGTTRVKVTDITTNTTTYITVNVKDSSLESIIVNEPSAGSTITRTPILNTQTGEYETKIKYLTNRVSTVITATDSNARIEYIDQNGNILQDENDDNIQAVGTLTIDVDTPNNTTYVYYRIVSASETESTIYTLKIDKMSNNTIINGVKVDEEPATLKEDGTYSAVVKGSKTTATVKVTKNDDKQTIYIDNVEGDTKEVTLTGIKTIVKLKVKAEDGTIEEKTLVITRTTSISGKILTENHEGKHLSKIVVFRTEDTRPEDLENRVNPDGTINTTVREVVGEAETKEDGSYEIDLYVTDITPVVDSDANGIADTLEEQYDVLVIKDGYLRYRVTNIELTEGETVDLGTYELLAGDVVETEEININDLVSENNNVGVTVDDTNKQDKEKYDFNEDGDIDGIDREILKKNFGKKSEVVQWISPTTYSLKRMRRKENEEADDLEGTSEVKVKELMILPIECDYEITSPYGERIHPVTGVVSRHTGIDLGGEHHTPIFAVADGEVVFSGAQKAFGNCIEIKHEIEGEIVYSFYAHLSKIDVKEGEKVTQGQIIGLEGGDPNTDPNPGSSTGHHLHFEIRKASGYGNDIDPKKYLKF